MSCVGSVPIARRCRVGVLMLAALGSVAMTSAQDSIFSTADAYERFMGRWSRALAPALVRFAGVRDADIVLDVGAGTGALAAAVAAAAPAGRVIGIDPSAAYVAFARAKRSNDRSEFEVGDARQMRFSDATFDRTLSLLVLNFIPDAGTALREMTRVTRPGGTVAAAVWDYGEGMGMLRTFWDAAIALRPGDEEKDERHMPFSRRGQLAALWRGHGLRDVVEEGLTIETRFSSFEEYWQPFTEGQGPAGAYVSGLGAAEREQLRLRLRQQLIGSGPDRPLSLTARAWAVRGAVP